MDGVRQGWLLLGALLVRAALAAEDPAPDPVPDPAPNQVSGAASPASRASADMTWAAGASASVTADSNATRARDAGARSDQIVAESVHAQASLPVSLQKVLLQAGFDTVHYRRLSSLDYRGNDLSLTWLGDLPPRLAPEFTVFDRRSVVPLANVQAAVRDVVHDQGLRLHLDHAVDSTWGLGLQLDAHRQANSDPGSAYNDNLALLTGLRARYRSGTGNAVSLALQQEQVRFRVAQLLPDASSLDNAYRDRRVDLGVQAGLQPDLQLDARAGWQQRTYEVPASRDFHGPTGRISLRETRPAFDLGASFERSLGGAVYLAATALVVDHLTLDGRWKCTPRAQFDAIWSHSRENYQADPVNAQRLDTHITRALNVQYLASAALAITLALANDTRSSSLSSNDFSEHSVQLALSFHL